MASKPFKQTSQLFNIGASVTESAAATFTEAEIELPLSSLDREIFVVTDVLLQMPQSVVVAGSKVTSDVQVTKTSVSTLVGINDPTCVARARVALDNNVGAVCAVTEEMLPNQMAATGQNRDYLGIIATPQFFISAFTQNGPAPTTGRARITGFRAVATADLYAALVTEELNF